MDRFILTLIIAILATSCRNDNDDKLDSYFFAEIVGFDLNCASCFLKFPNDFLTIKEEIGESENNYYHAINLDKDTFKIGQKIKMKIRKAKDQELRLCITLYPSSDFENIYVIDWKSDK